MQYDSLLRKPKLTIIFFTLITAVISINALHVKITSDIEVYMPENEPSVMLLNEIRNEWPVDSLMIYLKGDNLTDISHLKEIDAMENAINPYNDLRDQVVYTASIASLVRDTNANFPCGEDKIPDNQRYANILLRLIPDEIKYNLISHDDKDAVIIVTTTKNADTNKLLNDRVYPISESAKGIKAIPTGMITMYTQTVQWIMERIYNIALISLLLIVLALFAFHKDIKTVFIAIVPVLYAVGLTFGTMGLSNTKFAPTVIAVLPLLASLGVAYSLHMINYFMELIGKKPFDAIKRTINTTGKAVFLSAITTIVGFASLLSSNMPPIANMGLAFLIGVLYSFISTMILVPALLLVLKPKRKVSMEWHSLANLTKYRKHIILILIIISFVSIASIPKVSTRTSVWEMMPMKMESNVLMHEYSNKFNAGQSGVILIDSHKKEGMLEPKLLEKMDEMEKMINVGVENASAYSVVDAIKKANFGKLPDTKEEAKSIVEKLPEKYKIMMLDKDYRKTLVYVDMPIMSVQDTKRAVASVDEIISQYNPKINGYGEVKQLTGLAAITVELNEMLMNQQFRFTFISLLLVFLCLLIVFRSFRFASLTMIPITLLLLWEPALLVLLNIPLNVSTITVSSIAIGVGIDFSVHITERVMEEIKTKKGLQAIKIALTRKSPSLVEATIALVGGGIPIFLMEYEMITQFIVLVLFMLSFACLGSILTLASVYSAKNGKIVEGWK